MGGSGAPSAPASRPDRVRASNAHLERRTLTGVAILVIGVWFAVVFAGIMAEANHYAAVAAAADEQTDRLRAQVAAGRAEITTVQSDPFHALQARVFGYGKAAERAFALRPGAPPPPSITPLGTAPAALDVANPLNEWLDLLLGR